ncbi:MAG TPA: YihY/virulence factor BrkB family protein [Candidatus Saccharimonadales bacterium]|nr:YihY/virulence factor BrkB family protein [Candidatus Saccharimonadales bacterium]
MKAFTKRLLKRYSEDGVANHAAALSYYTVFALGPLLFIILGIVGLIVNNSAARQHLLGQLNDLIGRGATNLLSGALSSQGLGSKTGIAFWIGGVGLVLGAIGIFGQLQRALNDILRIQVGPSVGRKKLVRQKVVSLGLVGVICFLLIVSLIASVIISAVASHLSRSQAAGFLFHLLDGFGSIIILGFLLMLLYRTLPAVKIAWGLLFKASLMVAVFFVIGKYVLGLIIGRNGTISAFGAAGSLIALLLWIFYSGQILYLGAAGLGVYLENHPEKMRPRYGGKNAVLKVQTAKKPLKPDLIRQLATSFIEGWKDGWSKN